MGIRGEIKGGDNASKELDKILSRYDDFDIEVGVPEDAPNYPDGTSVALVAAVQEFGSPANNIPERSFLRSTIKENKKEYSGLMTKSVKKAYETGKPLKKLANKIGLKAADDVKQKITSLRSPANEASTIKAKKSSNPLIDTGHLRNSITYEVVDK